MIYIATLLLFCLAVLTVYAIIQTNKNRILVFLLIPLVLVSSLYTGYSIYALQGTPINTLPKGEVEVLWAEVQKPHIYFLVRHTGEPRPQYYTMPYSENNARKMQNMGKQAEDGTPATGEFKETEQQNGLITTVQEFTFDNIRRDALPPKRKALQLQGVDQRIINEIHSDPNIPQ